MTKVIYPHPECMAPDGADPCEGYKALMKHAAELESKLTDGGVYIEAADHQRIVAKLESKLERARFAIQAAIDCGIIPNSTATDSGAASRSEQVRVADMLRAALEESDGD